MKNDWLSRLQKLDGAVLGDINPHDHVIHSPSPSLDFTFGKGWGLPLGYTLAIGGPPNGGKTLIALAITGQLHRDDPDAIVIKWNTELRERVQSTAEQRERVWGVDPKRFLSYEVNSPVDIFDRIETEVAKECQQGMPLRLVVIDSIDGIAGRRSLNSDSVATTQIGDWAQTLGDGFKRILPVQRRYNFAVLLNCQIRTEFDRLEQMRGNSVKVKLPLAVQHYSEFVMYAEPNRTKAGRTNLTGQEFVNDDVTDLNEKGDVTGHKIRVKMKKSSCGPQGRSGEFAISYEKGIINVEEEVFLLGVNRGVIQRLNNISYGFEDRKYAGKAAILDELRDDLQLQTRILAELKRRDNAGAYSAQDAEPDTVDEDTDGDE